MPALVDNMQPYLVLNPLIATSGIYPTSDGGGGTLAGVLGQIHFFASSYFTSPSVQDLDGELMTLADNAALFSLLGTQFGGDGEDYFALPDFGGRVNVSAGQGSGLTNHVLGSYFGQNSFALTSAQMPTAYGGSADSFSNVQASSTVGWHINAFGVFPSSGSSGPRPDMIGMVGAFAGNFAPNGAIPCDGRLLLISEYDTLFMVIGTQFGGDGETTFAVPDLRGRSIMGAGSGPDGITYAVGDVVGLETGTVTNTGMPAGVGGSGQPIINTGPSLVLSAVVALSGIFGGFDEDSAGIGEVLFFAGNYAPGGALAQGQLLPINQNQALFSLLGTNFGGNGYTHFALPNLAGRVVVGDGAGFTLGQTGGGIRR